jgi:hypothetical protein
MFEALEERTLLSSGSHRMTDLAEHVGRGHKHRHDRAEMLRVPAQMSTMTGETAIASHTGGGTTTQNLTALTSSAQTADKPQSKIWRYDDEWWGVFPNSTGTYIWRLDGTSWTQGLKLSTATGTKADTLAVGDVTHVLLFRGTTSELASVQYNSAMGTYEFWSQRPTLSTVTLPAGVETGTIAMDSTGRLWLAADGYTTVSVRYSDSPYTSFSAPIDLVNNITSDDISVIGALPNGSIGVMWSNQTTDRFGFRLHVDGTDPLAWGADEVPASQSALNVGGGMADDHLNLAIASDSTLYVAAKTSYDTVGFPEVVMLVRRPNGIWDNLYQVETNGGGTRPIVVLNEASDHVSLYYTEADGGGKIVYRQSPLSPISFGSRTTLMNGTFNNASSTRQIVTNEFVLVANGSSTVNGVLQTLTSIANQPPVVSAGPDQALYGNLTTTVDGSAAGGQPNPPGSMTTTWSKLSGPGTVNFGSASAVDTTATFSAAGTYVLRLTATDGGLSSHDDVTVEIFDYSLETISFQDGLFPTTAYAGTRDLRIRSGNPTTNYETNTTLGVDGSPDDGVLLKWDTSAIPAGITVDSASITIYVIGTSTDNYELYELKKDWDEAQASWNNAATGVSWSVPGADGITGPSPDRGTTVLATVGGLTSGLITFNLNAAGLAVLQNWINNPSTNNGFLMMDYASAGDDLGFRSSEISTKTQRPKLNVTYTVGNNESPTITNITNQSIDEDGTTGALAFTVGDAETPVGNLTVSGSSSNTTLVPNGNVIFGGSGANRTVTVTPLANQSGTATITVTVSDGSATASDTFLLTVNAVNDAPTISDIANRTIDEDASSGAVAFTIGDIETPAGSLTVSGSSSNTTLVPNGNIIFGGSGANRTVTVTPAANQFGSATITVTVNDGTTTTSDMFLLTVNAVNDPPTISEIVDQMIDEEGSAGPIAFMIGDVETVADILTVSGSSTNTALVPNGNIVFGGSGAARSVTVTPLANQSGSATITVTVNDGTTTTSDTFLLTVNEINDPPTISDIADQIIDEDGSAGAILFTIGDVETAAGSLTVSGSSSDTALVPNVNIVFGGSGSDRTVTVTPAANQSGSATITITVDDGSTTTSDTFLLTVNALNDPPTISDIADQMTSQDTPTPPIPFTVGDVETPAGSLTLLGSSSNATLVLDTNIVFGGSGADRTVTITPEPGQMGTTTITVTVSDGSTTTNDTFLLTVTIPNDPPTISDISDQSIDEDTATGALAFMIGDTETDPASLTVSGSSSNTTLVPVANIVFGGSGADRTVTVTPVGNQSGTATITVTVSDGIATASDTFLLTVAEVNDLPTISDIADQGTNEDTATPAIAFTIGDVETAAGSLTVSGSSSDTALVPNGNIVFGGSGTDRTVTVTPAGNVSGMVTITVTIDDGVATTSDTFTLNIVAVNDVPSFTSGPNQSITQDSGPQSIAGWATAISAGPADESGQVLTFNASNDNNALFSAQPAVAANGTLTFTSAPGATGTTTVTLTLQDDGGMANGGVDTSAAQTFTITITSTAPPTTVSFQEGVNGYIGTSDATIKASNAIGNYGTTSNLVCYGAGTSDEASLVKWDISTIPTNVTVVSASITFYFLNGAVAPETYEVYEVLRPWIESEITWNQPAAGAAWGINGAQAATDHGAEVLGTVEGAAGAFLTITFSASGVAMVQRWVNTPNANSGVIIQDYSATDWTSIASSEYSTVTKRPKLTVTYQ